ncbi:MAG: DUF1275 domain-containing protein [Atopobiaceae bacterium]|nr:DUF1275 domain-containing protein [Atopobiaceae bacterium]
MAANESALLPSQRMRVAYTLTLVGGYLDAYTYFERGGVFANAQTGNIVKLAIALAHGESATYLQFLLPILTFALGLFAALTIQEKLEEHGMRLKRRAVLATEIVALAIVGLIPLEPQNNALANCIVSFVAAMQYEAFSTFRGDAIATTMSTGNLRKFVDALYAGTLQHDPEKLAHAAKFLSVILVFFFGAFLGTRFCDVLNKSAVVPPIVCLALAIVFITLLRRRARPEE